MYFKFHENLPVSVIRVNFDLYAENTSELIYHSLTGEVCDKSAIIDVPTQVTHIHAVHCFSPKGSFTYYYPGEGYPLNLGSYLPPFSVQKVGAHYAGGMVIETGSKTTAQEIEEDMLPFKGKIIALEEYTKSYPDAELHYRQLQTRYNSPWRLPDILELVDFYFRQKELSYLLESCGGSPLSPKDYWCQDNSVIELGVAFHMSTRQPSIVSKEELKQARFILEY